VPNLAPGDVIITNDPYTSNGLSTHLPDLHLIMPYFMDGRIIAYGWSFVHCSDIGGSLPGSVSPALTSIYQEGMRIPPIKLVRAGELNADFIALLRVNSRIAEVVIGDLKAMLGALETGYLRIKDLVAKQGVERLLAACFNSWRSTAESMPSFCEISSASSSRTIRLGTRWMCGSR
jgi:N-methylhydantoinase B